MRSVFENRKRVGRVRKAQPGLGRAGELVRTGTDGFPAGRAEHRCAGPARPSAASPLPRPPASGSPRGRCPPGPGHGLSPAGWPQSCPSSSIGQPGPQRGPPPRMMQGERHRRHCRRLRASWAPQRAGGARRSHGDAEGAAPPRTPSPPAPRPPGAPAMGGGHLGTSSALMAHGGPEARPGDGQGAGSQLAGQVPWGSLDFSPCPLLTSPQTLGFQAGLSGFSWGCHFATLI
jgi:hypothetical protein